MLDAFVQALGGEIGETPVIVEYAEHALTRSSDAQAMAYVQLAVKGQRHCGVGRSTDIVEASMHAVLGALNDALATQARRVAD